MDRNDICRRIAKQYYAEILRYCRSLLHNDPQGAEDCTQEVFLILIQKKSMLFMDKRISTWLYKTADRVIKNYRRRERKYAHESFDEEQFSDSIKLSDDGGLSGLLDDSPLDLLTDDERELIKAYYDRSSGTKQQIAARFGLTLSALYSEIHRIKTKLRDLCK